MEYPAVHLTVLGTLMAVACAGDVAQRRIPNAVVVAIAVAGFGARWVAGGPAAALGGALAGTITMALLLLPWTSGKLGGGDLKLLAATAIWIGLARLPAFLMFVAAAGLPVALATRIAHRVTLWRAFSRVLAGRGADDLALLGRETVPVAVAVALGAVAALRWGAS